MATFSDWKLSVDKIPLPQGQDSPKITRAYSSVERVGGYLYVIGEIYAQLSFAPAIGVLDIRRDKWLSIPYEGIMIHRAHVFLYDDGLYVYAYKDWKYAYKDWKGSSSGRVSRFDLIEEEWSYCHTTGKGPGVRRYCSGDYLESLDYFVGFGGKGLNTDVHVLLMPECKWVIPKVKGQPPAGRLRHGSCVYQDVIYYYGGWSQHRRQNDGIFLLTFTNRNIATWSLVESTVGSYIKLSAMAMFAFSGKIMICGGKKDDGQHGIGTYCPKTERFEYAREYGDYGEGLSGFTINAGLSFGLICGHQNLSNYYCLSIVKES